MSKILIVDDEANMRRILASNLAFDRHTVTQAASVSEAVGLLAINRYDAIITDQKMPDGEGLDVLARAHEVDPTVAVVMLTAFATVELAVESMRQGAFDFITKPFQPDVVRAAARRACEHTQLLRENGLLRMTIDRLEGSDEIFGNSAAMQAVRERIARVAPTHATVLITGETGTGKELVARAVHKGSNRARNPFVAVNCAAFTETLLESELFGHEKGAFTGADRMRQGLFEAAHEGTLFLDEAGEMSASTQAKLLRVLAEGKILRVGSTKPRDVDVRVVAATHRNLEELVKQGDFRQDLYYRLAVVPIHLPPLRERTEDIPGLCTLFCRMAAQDLKVPLRAIRRDAIEKLQQYAFPGNIRELRNLIERALILASGSEIGPEDFPFGPETSSGSSQTGSLPEWIESLPESISLRKLLEDVERGLIVRALKTSDSVQAEAARRLELSRSDLSYKLTKFEIKP
ncbi:sigma-54-dependent transcriptional regulator [Acidicapsa dinghuensis]|uniref:Sigma-54-dependent transcriptional regulator n=1 Tax=Acidicapsa dinghuensis TaxID=2218256 RepID=A0ABW1ED50_9BACT|nr:sigma-54 dependent transcriptional regulator [Acidicapsa dinghuensis]